MNVYPFIEAEKQRSHDQAGGGNVARACELLKVSRSAYYAHAATRAAGGTTRTREDAVLLERIEAVHDASKGTYGAPRIHEDLAEAGHRHGRKRIARLMRAAGLRGRTPRRWRTTTTPDPAAPARPDLIARNFTPDPFGADQRWCGDITYIRTWQGWLYLATVIDIATRRVVGWATADHLRTDLVEEALRQAVRSRRPQAGVIFHSDRGCQYTSAQFADAARELGVTLSVGRTGQCWDNALAESFFATIKGELLEHRSWQSHAAARAAIFDYIEGWYNIRRRHSTLGYLSPATYEATAAPAAA
ncbi:MAG TPA: IS3 family transposase [Pseudonocardia sp.]|nr:IS3 family transposase [Pseudonocardia sp.]